jgi:hypothetical protein
MGTAFAIGLGLGLCIGLISGVGCGIAAGISMEKKRLSKLVHEAMASRDIRVQDRESRPVSETQLLSQLRLGRKTTG